MTRNAIRIIISLATIIFIGLVSTQIFWVRNAYNITNQQIKHEIELALIDVVHEIQTHSGDSTFLVDPVEMISENFYRVQINEELQPFYLESLLKTELLNRELNYKFQFSIYNCFNDSVVFAKTIDNEADLQAEEIAEAPPPVDWDDDGHYFSVFFPTIDNEVFSRMNFWLISSSVLLIVLVFFAYVINVILRQKRLSEIKNDFINNMTHELKTPISTIALSSDVLLSKDIVQNPERLENYARIIKSENQRLQNQVERVLQIARLDKDEIDLKRNEVDIHELLELAAQSIEMNFPEKELKIGLTLKADPCLIIGDDMHLLNVFNNLLDNAAKYGGDKPQISVASTLEKGYVQIAVKDNGPGIGKDQQKQIFEKFYRIPTGNVHDVKGFGLGLHYVKTIVEAHHGNIALNSTLNQGSEFIIRLPYGMDIVN